MFRSESFCYCLLLFVCCLFRLDFKFRDRADSDEDGDVYKIPKNILSYPQEAPDVIPEPEPEPTVEAKVEGATPNIHPIHYEVVILLSWVCLIISVLLGLSCDSSQD